MLYVGQESGNLKQDVMGSINAEQYMSAYCPCGAAGQ
jgi:hypothetical protein